LRTFDEFFDFIAEGLDFEMILGEFNKLGEWDIFFDFLGELSMLYSSITDIDCLLGDIDVFL
jgi:hypothetical protein